MDKSCGFSDKKINLTKSIKLIANSRNTNKSNSCTYKQQ